VNQETIHSAWRYLIYIRELGAEPIVYAHRNHRAYAAALQHQYIRLSRAATRTEIKAAKARAAGLMKRKGLMRAAGIERPDQISPSLTIPVPLVASAQPVVGETFEHTEPEHAAPVEEPAKPGKAELWNCRRKIRHRNYLTAMLHATRVPGPDVRAYPCAVCNGIHVGHDSDAEATRRYRKLLHRLRTIDQRMAELDKERRRLESERRSLSEDLREISSVSDGPAMPQLADLIRLFQRLAGAWQTLLLAMPPGFRRRSNR
jgi:hypothetical protein